MSAEAWAEHDRQWRDPAQVVSQWEEAARAEPRLLETRVRGAFWDVLEGCDATLLVTREYEHLLMALTPERRARVSFMRLPHPSGLAYDARRGVIHVASTRNPNQIYELAPVVDAVERRDMPASAPPGRPLVPIRSTLLPGSLYLHDLAMVGGKLHGNAVGHNAVVRFGDGYERRWWPRCIERGGEPDFTRNYIQLNSIAAGSTLASSYFSASSAAIGRRRPGHVDYPVDGRGVIFSGRTREPMAGGLTRPHSARLRNGRVWVDNSGYGEVGVVDRGAFAPLARLRGWTRGLCFAGEVAFVGTSRVIPRFRRYAPGLDVERSICGVHALDVETGAVLGSVEWPAGNQIFGVEAVPRSLSRGLPFHPGRQSGDRVKRLFYTFATSSPGGKK